MFYVLEELLLGTVFGNQDSWTDPEKFKVFYLSFSKTGTSYCFNFFCHSGESLFL